MTTCTWIGANNEGCKDTALAGKSYCLHHYSQVYQAGTAMAKRKKDLRVAASVWNIQDAFNEAVQELESEGYDFGEDRWVVEAEEL